MNEILDNLVHGVGSLGVFISTKETVTIADWQVQNEEVGELVPGVRVFN